MTSLSEYRLKDSEGIMAAKTPKRESASYRHWVVTPPACSTMTGIDDFFRKQKQMDMEWKLKKENTLKRLHMYRQEHVNNKLSDSNEGFQGNEAVHNHAADSFDKEQKDPGSDDSVLDSLMLVHAELVQFFTAFAASHPQNNDSEAEDKEQKPEEAQNVATFHNSSDNSEIVSLDHKIDAAMDDLAIVLEESETLSDKGSFSQENVPEQCCDVDIVDTLISPFVEARSKLEIESSPQPTNSSTPVHNIREIGAQDAAAPTALPSEERKNYSNDLLLDGVSAAVAATDNRTNIIVEGLSTGPAADESTEFETKDQTIFTGIAEIFEVAAVVGDEEIDGPDMESEDEKATDDTIESSAKDAGMEVMEIPDSITNEETPVSIQQEYLVSSLEEKKDDADEPSASSEHPGIKDKGLELLDPFSEPRQSFDYSDPIGTKCGSNLCTKDEPPGVLKDDTLDTLFNEEFNCDIQVNYVSSVPVSSPIPTVDSSVSSMGSSIEEGSIGGELSRKTSASSLSSFWHMDKSVDDYSEALMCSEEQYLPNLHSSKGPCERCLTLASKEERAKFLANGRHVRIMLVRGGCKRTCTAFPRSEDQAPVRLCRRCYFDTHRPRSKAPTQRLAFP